ncbi:MAG: peptidoglycan-binding protein LysM [Acidobacteria bacterium]|nr:peptidoglycan-binding protein LysM [Acidobacteriota bacterium]
MSLFSFVKDAGKKLLGFGDDEAPEAAAAEAAPAPRPVPISAGTLHAMLASHDLAPSDLSIAYDEGTVTVSGTVDSIADREKIVIALGNVQGVESVDERLVLANALPDPVLYTVVSGDTLSGIAKDQYGDAMKYPTIFEANRPMLEHPDKIYPGQVLRIPPLDD